MAETRKLDDAFDAVRDGAAGSSRPRSRGKQQKRQREESRESMPPRPCGSIGPASPRSSTAVRSKATDLVSTNQKAVGKIDAAMSRIRAVLHSNSGEASASDGAGDRPGQ